MEKHKAIDVIEEALQSILVCHDTDGEDCSEPDIEELRQATVFFQNTLSRMQTLKVYVSKELGSYYWMEEDELCTTTMMKDDGIIEFESGCMVDEQAVGDEIVTFNGEKMTLSEVYFIIRQELNRMK